MAWYQNPLSGPAADPSGIGSSTGGHSDYYVYTTGEGFPILHSSDLLHFAPVGTAFTHRPAWTVQTGDWHPWAPSVLQSSGACPGTASPSCFYMYYVGLSSQYRVNCVAVATATTPAGPFSDQGPLTDGSPSANGPPIGCEDGAGAGNIDPDPFKDGDGRVYLYVSTDWTCAPGAMGACTPSSGTLKPTISVIPLADTLLTTSGSRQALFSGDQGWETASSRHVVEGPWMEKRNGVYYLFYSGGDWTRAYGMGVATALSPTARPSKSLGNPILRGTLGVLSAGGGSTIIGPRGGEWMLYHARLGSYSQPRRLFIDPVVWQPNGSVFVAGPTTTRQAPVP